jgi:large subunit ribosomal protein L23
MRSPHEILKRPRITEKASRMSTTGHSVVIFEVPLDANKIEIEKAVSSVFNVQVVEVRTSIMRGKIKRRGRSSGKRPNWKKAMVTLAEGQEIDFFGGAAS